MFGWWRNPRARALFWQAATVAAVLLCAWWLADNTAANLARQNKTAGFGFLNDAAGFSINFHLIDYGEADSIWRVFAVGVLNTLLVSFLGIIGATFVGFAVGVGQLSANPLVRWICVGYVELIRNIPLLLQIFFWYFVVLRPLPSPKQSLQAAGALFNNRGAYLPKPLFDGGGVWIVVAVAAAAIIALLLLWLARKQREKTGRAFAVLTPSLVLFAVLPAVAFWLSGASFSFQFPELKGFNVRGGLWLPPEFIALLFSLAVYTASFIAENVRSGVLSVGAGQTEAYRALGLSRAQGLKLVVIPQALRVIIPPLTNQYLNLAKNSSLAIAIAYPELVSVFTGTVLNNTGNEIEVIVITMLFYLALSLCIAAFMNWYNRRYALIKSR